MELRKRDILVIRTNFLQLFFDLGDKFYEGFCEPGLVYSPELVQWFADMEIPNLVTDTIANEVTFDPNNGVALPLHCALMRNLGVALTEICDLEKLAAHSAGDRQYTFLYTAAAEVIRWDLGDGSEVARLPRQGFINALGAYGDLVAAGSLHGVRVSGNDGALATFGVETGRVVDLAYLPDGAVE